MIKFFPDLIKIIMELVMPMSMSNRQGMVDEARRRRGWRLALIFVFFFLSCRSLSN
jgi:hypothetical protein